MALAGCRESPKAAPAQPDRATLRVEPVIVQDVPIDSEWVGTLVEYIRAQIRPRVSRRPMGRGASIHAKEACRVDCSAAHVHSGEPVGALRSDSGLGPDRVMSHPPTRALLTSLVLLAACDPGEPLAPPVPEMLVVEVTEGDVPVIYEWLGTTEGSIDADIRAQVSGYLISRDYKAGPLQ